jgi:hypothetical protein
LIHTLFDALKRKERMKRIFVAIVSVIVIGLVVVSLQGEPQVHTEAPQAFTVQVAAPKQSSALQVPVRVQVEVATVKSKPEEFVYNVKNLPSEEGRLLKNFHERLTRYERKGRKFPRYLDGRMFLSDHGYRHEYGTKAKPLFTKEDLRFLKHYPDLRHLDIFVYDDIKMDEETCQIIVENANLEGFQKRKMDLNHVVNVVRYFNDLKELGIGSFNGTTEELSKALEEVSTMQSLEKLDIGFSNITDASAEYLKRMTNLKELDLDYSKHLSSKAVKEIMEALPNCKILPEGILAYKLKTEKERAEKKAASK